MLSRIDEMIYPNRCEVIEFLDPQRFVYPIFKNGRSSLIEHAEAHKYKIIINQQISKLSQIDVIIRDPQARFISGINTFVFNTKRDNPNLDINTIIYFAENYLFLNRHYAPQLSWLINLSKYYNSKLTLHRLDFVTQITGVDIKPRGEQKILTDDTILRLKDNPHNEMHLRLDALLLQLVGETLTFEEILKYLKAQDPVAYKKLSCIVPD
jgi:hypothetical protein